MDDNKVKIATAVIVRTTHGIRKYWLVETAKSNVGGGRAETPQAPDP